MKLNPPPSPGYLKVMGLQGTPGEARTGPHGSHGVYQEESGDTRGGQPGALRSREGEGEEQALLLRRA